MIAAIVPACGRSARMGQPKLLLPIHGVPLIQRVIETLQDAKISPIVVVGPPHHLHEAAAIHAIVKNCGACSVVPDPPTTDMRESFERGLEWLESQFASRPEGVLLVPGDSPGLTADVVRGICDSFTAQRADSVVPTFQGRRGHPLLLSWNTASRVASLPADVGINFLLRRADTEVRELPVSDSGVMLDLDTPDDYRRWIENASGAAIHSD